MLADALVLILLQFAQSKEPYHHQNIHFLQMRRPSRGPSDEVDSETSSVCSEMSLARNGDNGELREALAKCASAQFNDRKEGLGEMLNLIRARRVFTRTEIKKICDVFTRMFVDPHNKVPFCNMRLTKWIDRWINTIMSFIDFQCFPRHFGGVSGWISCRAG